MKARARVVTVEVGRVRYSTTLSGYIAKLVPAPRKKILKYTQLEKNENNQLYLTSIY